MVSHALCSSLVSLLSVAIVSQVLDFFLLLQLDAMGIWSCVRMRRRETDHDDHVFYKASRLLARWFYLLDENEKT